MCNDASKNADDFILSRFSFAQWFLTDASKGRTNLEMGKQTLSSDNCVG